MFGVSIKSGIIQLRELLKTEQAGNKEMNRKGIRVPPS